MLLNTEKVYKRSGKNIFWLIKNSFQVINKLKLRGFFASSLPTYHFFTLYTTYPTFLLKINSWTYLKEISKKDVLFRYNDKHAFFTSDAVRNYNLWSC